MYYCGAQKVHPYDVSRWIACILMVMQQYPTNVELQDKCHVKANTPVRARITQTLY